MPDHGKRSARTAELVEQLHHVVAELESMHPGRRFPLDGHLVGSIGEAAAEALFDLTLVTASSTGHDAVAGDGRKVEIKATYGASKVAVRTTSEGEAESLIVLRLSRNVGVAHEVVYNGPLDVALTVAGPTQNNGQASMSLARLRSLNAGVQADARVAER